MIEVKYGCVWGGWCTKSVYGPYGLVCGKILVGDGLLFHIIFCMILVMGSAVHGSGQIRFEVDPHPT